MRGIIRSAELLREQAGQCLHLITSGVEREFLRIAVTDISEALGKRIESLFPADFLELRDTTLGARFAPERPGQACRRILLHDPGGALGAEYTLVDRMFGITLDEAYFAIFYGHPDTTAAGAHVAGGGLDLAFGRACFSHLAVPAGFS